MHKEQTWDVWQIGGCAQQHMEYAAAYKHMYTWEVGMHRILNLTLFCICQSHLLPIYMARSDLTDLMW